MPRHHSMVAAVIFLLLAGCASAPRPDLAGKTIDPESVRRAVQINKDKIRSVTGYGSVSVESPELAQSGSFELELRKPDSVFVKIEGPFGISVGSALITRNNFVLYNSYQNQVITGPVNATNLRRIFRITLTFDELLNLFTGGSFLASDESQAEAVTVEDNQYILLYRSAAGSRRYWIDPATLLITRVQHLDQKGKLYVEERYEKFRTLGGASLPRFIRVIHHASRRAIGVMFSSLAINTAGAPLIVEIPKNAEQIRWEQ